MKKPLQKTILAVTAAIACLSLPASATTIITLNVGTSGGGSWTDTSGTFAGTLIVGQVIVSDPDDPDDNNATYTDTINLSPAADDFSLIFTDSGTPALTIKTGAGVEAPFANLTPSTAIETGTSGLGYTCVGCSSSTLSLSLAGGVSITGVLANFLHDLGLPTTPSSLSISGGITGSGSVGSGTISSDSIELIDTGSVTPSPEPSSMFLLGAGLAIAAAMARKRQLGAAKSTRACA